MTIEETRAFVMKIFDYRVVQEKDGHCYIMRGNIIAYSPLSKMSILHGMPKLNSIPASMFKKSNEMKLIAEVCARVRTEYSKRTGLHVTNLAKISSAASSKRKLRREIKDLREHKQNPQRLKELNKQIRELKTEPYPKESLDTFRNYWGALSAARKFLNFSMKEIQQFYGEDKIKLARRFNTEWRGPILDFIHEHERNMQICSSFPLIAFLLKAKDCTLHYSFERDYCFDSINNIDVNTKTKTMILDGAKLKHILEAMEIPKSFRKILPQSCGFFTVDKMDKFIELAKQHPEVFTDYMPTKTMEQYRWFKILNDVSTNRLISIDAIAWFAKALRTETKRTLVGLQRDIGLISDAIIAEPWGQDVSWEGGMRRQIIWHEQEYARAAQRREEQRALWQARNDAAAKERLELLKKPFPEQWLNDYHESDPDSKYSGYSVTYIKNSAELDEEGAAMHHCVSSYAERIICGYSSIYSVKKDNKRVATLELNKANSLIEITQLRGYCNENPKPETLAFVLSLIEKSNREIRIQENLQKLQKAAIGANLRAMVP